METGRSRSSRRPALVALSRSDAPHLPETGAELARALYARLALAAGETPSHRISPTCRCFEARHGTHGWSATRTAIERLHADMRR